MSLTNISFPYSIKYSCPPKNDQLISFNQVDINNTPMFNPLTYESVIPFPTNSIIPRNNFSKNDRDFQYKDPSKMNLPCK